MPGARAAPLDASGRSSRGLIELREDGVDGLALAPEAAAAGVILETFGAALERDPDGLRAELEGGAGAPRRRQARPARPRLLEPGRPARRPGRRPPRPSRSSSAGRPARPVVPSSRRTRRPLGDGAEASLVEELVASGPRSPAPRASRQSLLGGTLEVVLGRDASLAVASLQDLPAGDRRFQHRHAVIGEGATLHWALAQLGGRLVRSRVDNRLEGDRQHRSSRSRSCSAASDQLFDLTSYTRHIGRDTTGNLLSKGALMDDGPELHEGPHRHRQDARSGPTASSASSG